MPKQKTSCNPSPLSALADELGDLEVWAAPLAPRLARLDAIKKSIRQHFDASPADVTQSVEGKRFVVFLGPRSSEATVDISALAKAIGTKATLGIVKCTLKALDVFPGIVAAVVTRALTGARPMKTFEKSKP